MQTGCTTYTHTHLVRDGKIRSEIVSSQHFKHRLFHSSAQSAGQGALHVYIDGDGRPWYRRNLVAADPTSPKSLMLEAMLQDETDAVYLGRPCYYQVDDAGCGANWWTHDRYHGRVVESMKQVVETIAADQRELLLIGHSGGGTLAVLIGRRLSRPVKVISIAGNLDHRAWTDHHRYSPLTGSLNPLDDAASNPAMEELHWFGRSDQTILPAWSLAYCQRHKRACMPAEAGHTEGWLTQWPQILQRSHEFFAQ